MATKRLTRADKLEARRIATRWLHENPQGSLADARREIPGLLEREGIDPATIAVWVKFVLELIQQILALFRNS